MADQRKRLIAEVRAVVDGAKEVERLTQGLEGVENQARRDYKDPTQKIQRGLSNTKRRANQTAEVVGQLRGTFVRLAGVIGAGALGAQIIRTANELEEVNRQARSLGENVENIQELRFTFRQFQLEGRDVTDVLATISDRADDALSGQQSFIDDFERFGIAVDDLRGKSPAQLFRVVAEGISRIDNPQQQATAAVRLFGDEIGQRLLPLLTQGEKGLERYIERAHEVDAVQSEGMVKSGAEAAKTFRELRETIDAQFTRAVADNADALATAAEAITTIAVEGAEAAANLVRVGEALQYGSDRANLSRAEDLEGVNAELERLRTNLDRIENSRAGEALGDPDQIRRQIRMLEARSELLQREQQQDTEGGSTDDGAAAGDDGDGGAGGETEERTEKLRELIEAQREEARTVGMSAEELTIYRARQLGATEADIQAIREAYDVQQAREAQIEADKEAAQAAEDRAEAQKKAREQDAKTLASLQRELELQRMGEEARFVQQELDQLSPDAPKEMRKEVARLARELHGLRETTEETGKEMSEFAKSAARNMQSEFADFLFDPFDEGLDGLLDGFVRTLRRMAAEAAAAEIFDETFGGDQGFAKFLDSIFNSGGGSSSSSMGAGTGSSPASASGGSGGSGWASVIGSVIGAIFHDGGVVGAGGAPTRAVPAGTFAGADHFATGGVAGLGPREVPIIAHENEEILTDKDPRHRDNLGRGRGGGTTIIQNIQTPDAQSFRKSSAAVRQDLKMATGKN